MELLQKELIQNPRFLESFRDVTIYGVCGTNGSGKDALMDVMKESGFLCFSVGDSLRQVSQAVFNSIERGGNQAPAGIVGNAFRTAYPGGTVEVGLLDWWFRVGVLPLELWPKGLVIGSIRGVNEAKRLKEFGGKLIVVDADPRVRYERLSSRGRADEKDLTFEKFVANENAEMAVGETDHTKFGMAAVIDMADIRIKNDSNDLSVFKAEVEKALTL